ncbi:hypothetical protein MKY34_14175 [Sporosarcina sp. FSL K6-1522]|uniref:hypothetical protein n=1 Tax=Sporosarcina sp. FSL K6-1522 TaxID=2921554 RepID=UPI00315AA744
MKKLAEPDALKKNLMHLATLDVILCEEDWLRTYQFDSQWGENISLATIDNGAGDNLVVLFAPEGVILKGFDHESALSPHAREEYEVFPGIYDTTPASLLAYLEDEALERDDVTFCIWHETCDMEWRMGDVQIPIGAEDGSAFLLRTILTTPEVYVEWAENYYDKVLPVDVVQQVYEGVTITEEIIQSLNPRRNVQDALRELAF